MRCVSPSHKSAPIQTLKASFLLSVGGWGGHKLVWVVGRRVETDLPILPQLPRW